MDIIQPYNFTMYKKYKVVKKIFILALSTPSGFSGYFAEIACKIGLYFINMKKIPSMKTNFFNLIF